MEENPRKGSSTGIIFALTVLAVVAAVLIVLLFSHSPGGQKQPPPVAPIVAAHNPAATAAPEQPVQSEEEQPAEEPAKPTATTISYANGKTRNVVSDSDDNVTSYTDNVGVLWKLDPPPAKDGQYTAEDQQDVWHRFRADGTVIAGTDWHGTAKIDDDGNVSLLATDGSSTVFETDGSTINFDAANRITMIQYPDGWARSFEYADSAQDSDLVAIDESNAGGTTTYWKRVEKDDDAAYQRCRMQDHVCALYGSLFDITLSNDSGDLTFTNRDDKSTKTIWTNGLTVRQKDVQ
ncbi:MAG TPA: hypothetical protein V6C81_02500 [Planktothrix sp.]|jgi:hypothetical protein